MSEPMLQFFEYEHLPPHLARVSKPFCDLAHAMVEGDNAPDRPTFGSPLPRNPERTVALRHLLEAKDSAVRAVIYKDADTARKPLPPPIPPPGTP